MPNKRRRSKSGPVEVEERDRFSDVQAIVDALRDVCVDRHWVKYDEAKKCQDAKVVVSQINTEKSHTLLAALHKLSSKLTFVRSAIKEAISKLYEQNDGWGMNSEHKENYIDIMARRTINLCRVVGQGITHAHPPAWTRQLPFVSGEVPAALPPARQMAFLWVYTFDKTTRQAFRTDAGNNSKTAGKPEAAVKLMVDPEKQYPVAKFADGSEAEISDVLCSELLVGSPSSAGVEGAQAACAAAAGPPRRQKKRTHAELNQNVLFSNRHTVSSNLIQVKIRIDRKLLISIYDGGRQICQLPLNNTGDEQADDKDKENRKAFMIDLATQYKNNEIDRDGLFSARNDKFPSCSARVGILRKPAAAPTASAMPAAASAAPRVRFTATTDEATDLEDGLSNSIEADFSPIHRSESPDDVPSPPGYFSMGCGMDFATGIDLPFDPDIE